MPVELAEDALHVIRAGGVALLPRNRWDLASNVLELLGESKAWRLSELLWAKYPVRVVTEGLATDELDAGLRGVTTPTGNGGAVPQCPLHYIDVTSDWLVRVEHQRHRRRPELQREFPQLTCSHFGLLITDFEAHVVGVHTGVKSSRAG